MSMLSGQGLGPTGDGPRKRHPVTVLLMCAVLFGATYGAVRLLRGPSSNDASGPTGSPSPCVTSTVVPGVVLPKPGQVTSNVFNATTRAGLAKRTSNELQSRGFVIGRVANDPLSKKVTGVAEIRYGASGLANAQLMRYYLVGAVLVKDGRKDATIDVVLGDASRRRRRSTPRSRSPRRSPPGAAARPRGSRAAHRPPHARARQPDRLAADQGRCAVSRPGPTPDGSRARRRRPSRAGWTSS